MLASRVSPALVSFLAAVALALPPTVAAATPAKAEVQKPVTSAEVVLRDELSQRVAVWFPSPKLAILTVYEWKRSGYKYALYAVRTRSRLANGVLRARFGSIGRVDLRFQPNGKTNRGRPRKGCKGPRSLIEFGRARGTVSLRGENDYFRIDRTAGATELERSPRLVCDRGRARNIPRDVSLRDLVAPDFELDETAFLGAQLAVLNAVAKIEGRFIVLRAAHYATLAPEAEVQVGTLESENGMAIGRGTWLIGRKGTLRTSLPGERPATASLTPSAPFHGAATFTAQSPTANAWTGSLSVRLPGLEVPLTGPGFSTDLCVVSPLKKPRGCEPAEPKPSASSLLLGAGAERLLGVLRR